MWPGVVITETASRHVAHDDASGALTGSSSQQRGAASQGRDLLRAIGCVGFVISAGILEVVGGYGANSPEPTWAQTVFPIAWPQPVRVAWWLTVALAAFGYRKYLARAGFGTRRPVTALVVVPFVIFAVGVAASASWATWH